MLFKAPVNRVNTQWELLPARAGPEVNVLSTVTHVLTSLVCPAMDCHDFWPFSESSETIYITPSAAFVFAISASMHQIPRARANNAVPHQQSIDQIALA